MIDVAGYIRSPTPAAQDIRVLADSHRMLSKHVKSVCNLHSFQFITLVGLGNILTMTKLMLLAVPKTKSKLYGDRSFPARAPRLWNALLVDIKNSESLNIFKSIVRRLLFR